MQIKGLVPEEISFGEIRCVMAGRKNRSNQKVVYMKTPQQQDFEQTVDEAQQAYQKAGALQKLGINLQAFWLRLNLRIPIGMPCICTAIFGGIVLVLLDSLFPGSFEQSRVAWTVIALVIEVIIVVTWVKRNLALVDFVNQHLDETKKQ